MEIQTFAPFTVLRTHQPSDPDAPCSGQLSGFKERIDEARSSPVERHGQFIAPVFVGVVQPGGIGSTVSWHFLVDECTKLDDLEGKFPADCVHFRAAPD